MAVILTDERRHRRGNLRLSHRGDVGTLAKRRRVRAEHSDPDIFRTLLFDAVFFPLSQAAAPTVVSGDDESRCAVVLGHRLHGVPQLVYEMIHAMRTVEDEIVAPLMRPVVGLTVSHEQHARKPRFDVVEERYLQKG